jgi:flagellar hook assembly protein FlgD
MDADGNNETNLTNHAAQDVHPAWSPDGTKIAFRSDRHGNYEIYTMDANGNNVERLTNHSADDGHPAWSPDGTKIAFRSNRPGNYEIYTMDANGNNVVRLTNTTAENDAPAWSPDGTKIAFRSNRDGNNEIYVMNAVNGNDPINLTNQSSSSDTYPTWSPDGSKIAFATNRDSNHEIYVMNAVNGSNPVNRSNHPNEDTRPAWSPAASLPTINLSVGTAFGAPGDTLRIPLDLDTNRPVGGIQVAVLMTGSATFAAFEDTAGIPGFTALTTQEGNNVAIVFFSSSNAVIAVDTRLATLVYVVDGAAPLGASIPLTLGANSAISDSLGVPLPRNLFDGEIQVGVKGDLTQDGVVSILDVVRLARILTGKETAPAPGTAAFAVADANADDAIDVADIIFQVNLILDLLIKPVAGLPTGHAQVSLGEPYITADGQTVVPVLLSADGSIAGLQASFTFDPATTKVGTPMTTDPGLFLESHVKNGNIRVVVFSLQPGRQIAGDRTSVLLIPAVQQEGSTRIPLLTLTDALAAGADAQRVPVTLGQNVIQIQDKSRVLPRVFALHSARPNPFNPSTEIAYDVPQKTHVTLTVYNLLGQEVSRLVDEVKTPGRYTAVWDGRIRRGEGVASGVYVYRLISEGYSQTRRMTLLK